MNIVKNVQMFKRDGKYQHITKTRLFKYIENFSSKIFKIFR